MDEIKNEYQIQSEKQKDEILKYYKKHRYMPPYDRKLKKFWVNRFPYLADMTEPGIKKFELN